MQQSYINDDLTKVKLLFYIVVRAFLTVGELAGNLGFSLLLK
jgi:hypothetical protein